MCKPVYNLESYEYFQMGICRSLCHSSTFVNMRFVAKAIFSVLNSTRRSTFIENLLQNFVISCFTLTDE